MTFSQALDFFPKLLNFDLLHLNCLKLLSAPNTAIYRSYFSFPIILFIRCCSLLVELMMLQLVRNFPGNHVVLCPQVMLCISQGQERLLLKTGRNQNISGMIEVKMLVQGSVAVKKSKLKPRNYKESQTEENRSHD